MHFGSPPVSRFSVWNSLENAMDRYASYGAFAVGVLGLVAGLVLL